MNSFASKTLSLIIFLIGVTLYASTANVNTGSDRSWLKSTSLTIGDGCPQAPILYRGMSGSFFTIERAMENMLGDSLAELPSWRLSSIYSTLAKTGETDVANWENAKEIAAKELKLLQTKQRGHICKVANLFADLTMQGNDLKTRSQSLGIAFTPNKSYAAGYIGARIYNQSSTDKESPIQKGIMIGIKEQVPRAGYASDYGNQEYAEFYVPISVPKEDIFAAWTDSLHIEKKIDNLGNPKVEIYRVKNAEASLKFNRPLDEILAGEVVQCIEASEPCDSETSQLNDDLENIKKSIERLKRRGFRFKLVLVKVP